MQIENFENKTETVLTDKNAMGNAESSETTHTAMSVDVSLTRQEWE